MNILYDKKSYSWISLLIAAATSLGFSFLIYVYFFQSYGFSAKRVALALVVVLLLSVVFLLVTEFISKKYFPGDRGRFQKTVGFWMLMALLLTPHVWPISHYPISPIFQKTSEINISILFPQVDDDPVQLRGVWLDFDDQKYSSSSFRFSDEWTKSSEEYFLDSGVLGELSWRGKIGEKAKLRIFPMSTEALVTVDWDGEKNSFSLSDSTIVINKKSVTPAWYYALIAAARVLCMGYALFLFFTVFMGIKDSKVQWAVASLSLFMLGLVMVYVQYQIAEEVREQFYLQVDYHQAVLSSRAPSPYQYRILSEWLIEGLSIFFESMGSRQPYYFVFTLVRIFQSIVTYFLLFFFYRKLGFSNGLALIGVVFATGSLFNSFLHHGYSNNSYFDVIFYLSAALLILGGTFAWLPPLMVLASLNRETSALIPLMAFSAISELNDRKPKIILVLLAFLCWVLVFLFLRLLLPARELFVSYGYYPGLPLLGYNLSPGTFPLLFRFFGFVPLLGLLVFRKWPPFLRGFFAALIPIWFLVHFFASVVTETRLFFVPQFLVFVPSFLVFVRYLSNHNFSKNQVDKGLGL